MTSSPVKHPGGGIYYGWYIVAVASVSVAFWFGTRAGFSVFFSSLLNEYGWLRAEAAGVQSVAMLTYTLCAPLMGWLVGRFGPRPVIAPGIAVLAAGYLLCAGLDSLAGFYFFYGVVAGVGVTAISLSAYTPLLANWFVRRRGLASGITSTGMGLGVLALVPSTQYMVQNLGWRWAFALTGLAALVLLLAPNLLVMRWHPSEVGSGPDGDPPRETGGDASGTADNGHSLKKLLRQKRFWALLLFPAPAILGVYMFLVHFVRFSVDMGMDPMRAAFLVSMVGLLSTGFRIVWGWLSDHLWREWVYSVGMLLMLAGFGLLVLAESRGLYWPVYGFVIFFGVGWAALAPMVMAAASDLYAGPRLGFIYGLVEAMIGIGAATGSWAAGRVFDVTGSYAPAFVLAMVCCLLSIGLIWLAAPRKVHAGAKKRLS